MKLKIEGKDDATAPEGPSRLPYERHGDACRLAYECKFQILVSLRVF